MNRNVLVIAYYFPPLGLSGVQRTLKFVKYLPKYGWNPIVLTVGSDSYYAYDETMLSELEGITVYRTQGKKSKKSRKPKGFPGYLKQKLGRYILSMIYQPDSKIRWKRKALELGSKIMEEHNINAIFATAPPFTDFIVAGDLSERFNKPFIIDYRDTWNGNPFHSYPTPFHRSYSTELETELLKRARKAIVTTRYAKELLITKYRFLNHQDISIIPHGFDNEDFQNDAINKSGKFVITHSGLFQDNRTPLYFLQAIAKLFKSNPEIKKEIELRFVGLMRKSHLKLITRYKLEDITVCTGYLEHKEAVRNLLESDLLWLMLKDTIRSPGKLFEYFGAGKPILISAPDGIIKKIALESGAAIATEPKDVNAIYKAVKKYYFQWKSGELPKPDDSFREQFNREKLTAELSRELSLVSEI